MKDFQVLMPVEGFVKVTDRFDSLLQFLHSRRATIHLICRATAQMNIHADSAGLNTQQAQMQNMGIMLKHEMLDRMAQKMAAAFPDLTFVYHVVDKPLHDAVAALENDIEFHLLVIDQRQLPESSAERPLGDFHHLLASTNIPIWSVGVDTATTGDTVVAIDLPVHNLQHEQLNRLMVHTAHQLAQDFGNTIRLTHCWQLATQDFMRRWLKLTDIDIARFARVEKQQREAHLLEYIEQCNANDAAFQISIVDGETSLVMPELCHGKQTRLLILGHDQNSYGSMGRTSISLLLKATSDVLILPYAPFAQASFLEFIESTEHYPRTQRPAPEHSDYYSQR